MEGATLDRDTLFRKLRGKPENKVRDQKLQERRGATREGRT